MFEVGNCSEIRAMLPSKIEAVINEGKISVNGKVYSVKFKADDTVDATRKGSLFEKAASLSSTRKVEKALTAANKGLRRSVKTYFSP
jgi:hypothetical protein